MFLNWLPYYVRPKHLTTQMVFRTSRYRIMAGPFAGMRYANASVGSELCAKLLGSYEKELIPIVERIRVLKPSVVVDIGAAEGYYAIGLLFSNLCQRVIAYETEESGRALMRQLLQLNSIDESRLCIKGSCTPENLAIELASDGNPVLIMDVEGYESVLLDPNKVPGLKHAFILVEVHEYMQHGLSDNIIGRMQESHEVERIDEVERKPTDMPRGSILLSCLPKRYKLFALSERRGVTMHWLWLTPRSRRKS